MEDSQSPLERRWEFDNPCGLNGELWKQAHSWIIFNRFWRVVPQLKADLENLWSHSTSMLWRKSCRMILVRRVFHKLLVASNFGKRWKNEPNNTRARDRMDTSREESVCASTIKNKNAPDRREPVACLRSVLGLHSGQPKKNYEPVFWAGFKYGSSEPPPWDRYL